MNVVESSLELSPIWITLKTGFITIFITSVLGLFVAWGVNSMKKNSLKIILDGILSLPMVLPPTVLGFFLLLIFGNHQPIGRFLYEVLGVRVAFEFIATVIAAVVVSFPLMYRNTKSAFEQLDQDMILAARTLGFSEFQIFYKIMIPNALPGIISGCLLAFARGLGEYGATAMLAGNIVGKTRTLPLAVYSEVMSGNYHNAGIYVAIIVSICFIIILMLNVYQIYTKKKRGY